ncbi:hypothetical protein ACS8YF_19470, partial [Salinisphaera sp. SWV1]|uniref:hypothetical protein n=1 Tax=Salinisphaera sp. SWV1 TaxID=3454139 RepID=UPI003F847193
PAAVAASVRAFCRKDQHQKFERKTEEHANCFFGNYLSAALFSLEGSISYSQRSHPYKDYRLGMSLGGPQSRTHSICDTHTKIR